MTIFYYNFYFDEVIINAHVYIIGICMCTYVRLETQYRDVWLMISYSSGNGRKKEYGLVDFVKLKQK